MYKKIVIWCKNIELYDFIVEVQRCTSCIFSSYITYAIVSNSTFLQCIFCGGDSASFWIVTRILCIHKHIHCKHPSNVILNNRGFTFENENRDYYGLSTQLGLMSIFLATQRKKKKKYTNFFHKMTIEKLLPFVVLTLNPSSLSHTYIYTQPNTKNKYYQQHIQIQVPLRYRYTMKYARDCKVFDKHAHCYPTIFPFYQLVHVLHISMQLCGTGEYTFT